MMGGIMMDGGGGRRVMVDTSLNFDVSTMETFVIVDEGGNFVRDFCVRVMELSLGC